LAVVLLTALACRGSLSAYEVVKKFPDYQCQYTLPGKGWTWEDAKSLPNATCVARNMDGLVFVLTVLPVPPNVVMNAKFTDGFDEDLPAARARNMKKRGGRMTTFKGLPCYESDWLVESKFTAVIRVVIANGFWYQVQLLGNADPVDKRPDFEAVMNGFEFTSPPVPPDPLERGERVARLIGRGLAYVIAGFAVWGVVTLLRRRT
jgi:hypothetical protein